MNPAGVVLVTMAAAAWLAGQDVYSSSSRSAGGSSGVVVSITDFHNGDCDVKVKSPRGYIRSYTVPCGAVRGLRPGDAWRESIPKSAPSARRPTAPPPGPPPFLPRVKAGRGASAELAAEMNNCLNVIRRAAEADPRSPVNRLLNELREVPVAVHPRSPNDTSNATRPSAPGAAVVIQWSPYDSGAYPDDGASKIPCATLLHELTHAWENYNGYDNGEVVAVRAENWLIWKQGGTQRTKYGGVPLPRNQVVWPEAASPRP